ncbi:hypothetical protein COU76_04470 [Candidatus Peregrinibacteria bacterium CG10_big_fil_rev_8_21_14_0_10_49_10]|nr:MAG: hypothetical protein COU76_04470 [Candidatus Peregrinibacteria bacterium CG10_big_fil_rev_8_21_14_0_10_49_10]
MKNITRSPWFTVSLIIVGVILGYSIVLVQNEGALAAWSCPAKEHCRNGNCKQNAACASGECSTDCPGNCH